MSPLVYATGRYYLVYTIIELDSTILNSLRRYYRSIVELNKLALLIRNSATSSALSDDGVVVT